MITAIVSFKLPKRMTIEEATTAFKSTAPRYLGMPGLIRKHYFLTEAGDRAGGIYLWNSKAAAEACYSAEWKAMVAAKYGAPPDIVYVVSPIVVDNLAGIIDAV